MGTWGVPRPDPHMGFCLRGWTGWAVQIAEPGNGAVPGLVAPRGRCVPEQRQLWTGWLGAPPKG